MLKVVTGPMFSGKTTHLLKLYKSNQVAFSKCIAAKWTRDTRSGGTIKTHDGIALNENEVSCVNSLDEIVIPSRDICPSLLVAVDEAQFFGEDLLRLWSRIFKRYEKVDTPDSLYLAGLDLDFKLEPFGKTQLLIEKVRDFDSRLVEEEKLVSRCFKCDGPAPYTMRTANCQDQVLVGGSSLYLPACKDHHRLPH